jgi:hypothetical protein
MHPPSAMRIWQLPASVRSLAFSASAVHRRRYSVTARLHVAHEPLRVLFCGSDDFSIASLRALNEAKHDAPNLIQSIHVVHRPAKPTGRGLKTLREGRFSSPSIFAACFYHLFTTLHFPRDLHCARNIHCTTCHARLTRHNSPHSLRGCRRTQPIHACD